MDPWNLVFVGFGGVIVGGGDRIGVIVMDVIDYSLLFISGNYFDNLLRLWVEFWCRFIDGCSGILEDYV